MGNPRLNPEAGMKRWMLYGLTFLAVGAVVTAIAVPGLTAS